MPAGWGEDVAETRPPGQERFELEVPFKRLKSRNQEILSPMPTPSPRYGSSGVPSKSLGHCIAGGSSLDEDLDALMDLSHFDDEDENGIQSFQKSKPAHDTAVAASVDCTPEIEQGSARTIVTSSLATGTSPGELLSREFQKFEGKSANIDTRRRYKYASAVSNEFKLRQLEPNDPVLPACIVDLNGLITSNYDAQAFDSENSMELDDLAVESGPFFPPWMSRLDMVTREGESIDDIATAAINIAIAAAADTEHGEADEENEGELCEDEDRAASAAPIDSDSVGEYRSVRKALPKSLDGTPKGSFALLSSQTQSPPPSPPPKDSLFAAPSDSAGKNEIRAPILT
ncbi:hypothetical protein HDU96_005142 [Phlyctochytrium bullatum]|nr:hypothetical protein HDU96_005142 [Phlyctochytrium bullatum]